MQPIQKYAPPLKQCIFIFSECQFLVARFCIEKHNIINRDIGYLSVLRYISLVGNHKCLLNIIILVRHKSIQRTMNGVVLARFDFYRNSWIMTFQWYYTTYKSTFEYKFVGLFMTFQKYTIFLCTPSEGECAVEVRIHIEISGSVWYN